MTTTSTTFAYTGGVQTWTAPADCTVQIECWGASGAAGTGASSTGGLGGYAKASVQLLKGDVLSLYVGGRGANAAGGWNGGGNGGTTNSSGTPGGGGGASDVRKNGTALANRLIAAGGGGGGGATNSAGGAGGGTSGSAGTGGTDGGGGGTQSAGGQPRSGAGGTAGQSGSGGTGGTAAGGGGGGYYGGAGGGFDLGPNYGGGGGGSGMVPAGGTLTAGVQAGDGQIVLTFVFAAPYSPTLTAPGNGAYADAAAGLTFAGIYNAGDIYDCNAYAFRVKQQGGSYSYWNAATAALQSTEVWNPCAVANGDPITVPIPAGVLADGNAYNWSLNTQEAGQQLQGTYAPDATFIAQAPPTLAVTGPSGAVTTTSQPTTTWSATPSSGAQLTGWQVIWESGAYGTTPGQGTQVADLVGSDASQSAQCPAILDNGTTYRCFVQVTETGGVTSSWQHTDFSLELNPPDVPTLTVVAGTYGTTGAPVTTLTVDYPSGGASENISGYQIQASDDGGTTWADVRGASNLTPGEDTDRTTGSVDHEGPINTPRSYRARALSSINGQTVVSDWTPTATVTAASPDWWLSDPLDPTAAVRSPVDPASFTALHGRNTGAFQALGRKYPIVVSDITIGARSGTLDIGCYTGDDWPALRAVLDRLTTLLLRSPFGDLMYLWIASTSSGMNFGWTETLTPSQRRALQVPFMEVDRP